MLRRRERSKETKLTHALITILLLIAVMFYSIVVLGASPQVPLILGCMIAGIVSVYIGYTWEELLEGMLESIVDSLEAVLILILIGVLIGTWISCGAVPTMICYGIGIISPGFFLPACMIICTLVALAVGSWGTVGTIGLAFLGMGVTLQIPLPVVAGAVISGSYLGEIVSPLSDATNLIAAVVKEGVFDIVKKMIPITGVCAVACLIIYGVMGLKYAAASGDAVQETVGPLIQAMKEAFVISPLALIPLVIMAVCIIAKVPAIPSILAGAVSGMICAALLQGVPLDKILLYSYSGYVSESGDAMIDNLLSAGGIEQMLEPISIIIIAMSFGGIMKKSRQMEALVKPVISGLRSLGAMNSLAAVTSVFINVLIPDQYLSMSIPGQMYLEEYDKRGMDKVSLGTSLLGGGAVTSPLVPWNTCGIYCAAIIGCSSLTFGPYAFLCLLLPVMTIAWQLTKNRK